MQLPQWLLNLAHENVVQLVVGAVIAWLAYVVAVYSMRQFFLRTDFIEERKEKTLESMFRSIMKYTATFGYLVYALSLYVTNFENLLAGAGIIGVVVGFGAQSIIRDVLSGIFLLYEKQLHQGDFIRVNNTFNGRVEEIGLRFLKVREWSGRLLTIGNGEIRQIQNYNNTIMRVVERMIISDDYRPRQVIAALEIACEKLNEDWGHLLMPGEDGKPREPFHVYGITALNDTKPGIEYTIAGVVVDEHFFLASREARVYVIEALQQEQIKLAQWTQSYRTKS